jgi:hypothetical protein
VQIGEDLRVSAFPTEHRCPSQGKSASTIIMPCISSTQSSHIRRSANFTLTLNVLVVLETFSLGYCISRRFRGRLKEEFVGRSPSAIRDLKAEGHSITEEDRYVPELVYTGDTTFNGLLKPELSFVFDAELLIIESTYLDGDTQQKAADRGHIHLRDIVSNLAMFKNKYIVLVHLSQRYYNVGHVLDILRSEIPEEEQNRFSVALRGFGATEDITNVLDAEKLSGGSRRVGWGWARERSASGGGGAYSKRRTRLCKFYIEGSCLKGEACDFMHNNCPS